MRLFWDVFSVSYWNWCGMSCWEGYNACFKWNGALNACVTGSPYKQTQTRSEHMRCLSLFLQFASSSPSSCSLLASVSCTQTQTQTHCGAQTHTHTLILQIIPLQSFPWHWGGLQCLYEDFGIHRTDIAAAAPHTAQDASLEEHNWQRMFAM